MTKRAQAVGRLFAILAILAAAGCTTWKQDSEQERTVNTFLVQSYTNSAIENGVIAQHTLYPYHFVSDSAQLTPLGDRDLRILAAHYCQAPGSLNMPADKTPAELHRTRVEAVKARLAEQGVAATHVTIVDEMPGGPGMSSERVLQALKSEKSNGQSESAAGSSQQANKKPPTPKPAQASESAAR